MLGYRSSDISEFLDMPSTDGDLCLMDEYRRLNFTHSACSAGSGALTFVVYIVLSSNPFVASCSARADLMFQLLSSTSA